MFNYIKFKSKIIILKLLKKLDSYSTANRKLNKEIKEYEVKRAEMNKKFKAIDYDNARIIQTAWTIDDMNQAVDNGFKLHFVSYKENPEVYCKLIVITDPETGKISTSGDYRSISRAGLSNFTIYPKGKLKTNLPFATYLLPTDLKVGEIVLIEEVIEELVGCYWNQGDVLRLETCLAIWDGKNFEYDYVKPPPVCNAVG